MVTLILGHLLSALLAGWIGWWIVKYLPPEKI